MKREEFLGPYRSHVIETRGQRYYVRGHDPWVVGIFSPNKDVNEMAQFMLSLHSKYDRRWRWWSPSVPPPLFSLVVEEAQVPAPYSLTVRIIARIIALYAAWRSL